MNFTYEQVVSSISFAKETGKEELDRLFESVRTMRFYGFIDEETYDSFCKQWTIELNLAETA